MKNLILTLAFTIICLNQIHCQDWQWAKSAGSGCPDHVNQIKIDNSGNTYVLGDFGHYFFPGCTRYMVFDADTIYSYGTNPVNQLYLAKYASDGSLKWVRGIGGDNPNQGNCNNCEEAYHLCIDNFSNSIFVCGSLYGPAQFDTTYLYGMGTNFITRIDADGNFLWAKLYGQLTNQTEIRIFSNNQGEIYYSGFAAQPMLIDTITVPSGYFYAKLNLEGKVIWGRKVATNVGTWDIFEVNNSIYSLMKATQDTCLIDTIEYNHINSYSIFFACFDSLANIKWFKPIRSTNLALARMSMDGNGNAFIAGYFTDSLFLENDSLITTNSQDLFILKMNPYGNVVWSIKGNATNRAYIDDIVTDSNGVSYISSLVTGTITIPNYVITSSIPFEAMIMRIDNNGNCIGVSQLGIDKVAKITQDNVGNFVIAGTFWNPFTIGSNTLNSRGGYDIFIAKHDLLNGFNQISNERSLSNLYIYSNPNTGSFIIDLPSKLITEKNATLLIRTLNGKVIYEQNLNINSPNTKVDLGTVSKGMYLVSLVCNNVVYSGKMIVE